MSVPITTITLYQCQDQLGNTKYPVLESTHGETGSTGNSHFNANLGIDSFTAVNVEASNYNDYDKTITVNWSVGATLDQVSVTNIYGATGATASTELYSVYYQPVTGPSGATSPLKLEIVYGATAATTEVVVSVTNPDIIYGSEGLTISIDSSEDIAGPYTNEWSTFLGSTGDLGIITTLNFPTTKYLRLNTDYPPIPEASNQTSINIYRTDLELVTLSYEPNYVGATGITNYTQVDTQIPIKSGSFIGTDLVGPSGAYYYYDIVFDSSFHSDTYTISITPIDNIGKIRGEEAGKYEGYILNKGVNGFSYQIYSDDSLNLYQFGWTCIFNGDTGTSSEKISSMERNLIIPEKIRYDQYGVTGPNKYYINVSTVSI